MSKNKKIMPFQEPGHTQFSNDALDYVMSDVSPNAWKVICVAVRKTYGWHRQADVISYSQFMKLTGIGSKTTLKNAIYEVLEKGILKRVEVANSYSYWLNREYVQKVDQYRKCTESGTKSVPKNGTETVHTKESIKKEDIKSPKDGDTKFEYVDAGDEFNKQTQRRYPKWSQPKTDLEKRVMSAVPKKKRWQKKERDALTKLRVIEKSIAPGGDYPPGWVDVVVDWYLDQDNYIPLKGLITALNNPDWKAKWKAENEDPNIDSLREELYGN